MFLMHRGRGIYPARGLGSKSLKGTAMWQDEGPDTEGLEPGREECHGRVGEGKDLLLK